MRNPPPLILASTSRYRRDLLARLQWPFRVEAPAIDEAPLAGEPPPVTALRLAEAKARAVASLHPDCLVIGSDQVADCDGMAVSKPADHADAVRLLGALSGRTIVFHTGVALVDAATGEVERACIDVASTFRRLATSEIETYLAFFAVARGDDSPGAL